MVAIVPARGTQSRTIFAAAWICGDVQPDHISKHRFEIDLGAFDLVGLAARCLFTWSEEHLSELALDGYRDGLEAARALGGSVPGEGAMHANPLDHAVQRRIQEDLGGRGRRSTRHDQSLMQGSRCARDIEDVTDVQA